MTADYSFISTFWEKVNDPDIFDAIGTPAGFADQYFAEIGKISGKIQSGALTAADVDSTKAILVKFADGVNRLNSRITQAVILGGNSIADTNFSNFFRILVSKVNISIQSVTYAANEAAAGAPIGKFSEAVSAQLKNVAGLLGLIQIGNEFYNKGFTVAGTNSAGEKAIGVLAGMVGGEIGAAALGGFAAFVGLPATIVAAAAIGGAVAFGYGGGKAGESLWEPSRWWFTEEFLPSVFTAGSDGYNIVNDGLSDWNIKMGKFNGTWLEGLTGVSDADKATFSTLMAGVANIPATASLNADLQKLFAADFSADALVGRDILVRALLSFAKDNGYATERVNTGADSITLNLPKFPTTSLMELRGFVEGQLDAADQAGFSITGPGRIVIATASGTVTAGADDTLMVGSDGSDTLIGGAGDDDLIGGAAQDTLEGGAGTDDIFGSDGDDVLDGGEGSDYLRGGAGNDTYKFSGAWGADTIIDSDGQGQIEIDGIILVGGQKIAEGVWHNKAQGIVYSLSGTGPDQTLVIQRDSSLNSIRIRGWQNGQLGLAMDDTQAPSTGSSHVLVGDHTKVIESNGVDYVIDADGNYLAGGDEDGAEDIFNGTQGADEIYGLGGNDGIAGGDGDDLIEGGDGDDLLLGGMGADTILGGEGNDYILGSAEGFFDRPSKVNFYPPSANGPVIARGFSWVVYQEPGADHQTIIGAGNIYPNGETTGNYIDGGAGNDVIGAGTGSDVAHGGSGNDKISGMGGSDQLFGDDGNDVIFGDGVQDPYSTYTPYSEHGNDVLDGGAGDDYLVGQGGDDQLFGGSGADILWGDDFDEERTLVSLHGKDYLDGEDGDDQLVGGGGDDVLYGGSGNDTLYGDTTTAAGGYGYLGGAHHGDDYLDGEDGDDVLKGQGGDDTLFGGTGDDLLIGDDAQDTLDGQFHGSDFLDGENGDDELAGGGGDDILYGGSGNDVMAGDALGVSADYEGDDDLYGEEGNDYLFGNGGNDYLDGGEGDDYLDGGDGNDVLFGGAGENRLLGGEGNDLLISTSGNDYLNGGVGNDIYQVALTGGALTIDDALGTNTIQITNASVDLNNYQVFGMGGQKVLAIAGAGSINLGADVDLSQTFVRIGSQTFSLQQIVLNANPTGALQSVSEITATGAPILTSTSTQTLHLVGGDIADALTGGSAADVLEGGAGNDVLRGGIGNDVLYGGAGADVLEGGAGDDILYGGGAQGERDGQGDIYLFNAGDGHDQINGGASGGSGLPLDIIRFGHGISASSIQLTSGQGLSGANSADFMITYGNGDTITVGQGALADLAAIEFEDGSSLTHAQILALLAAQAPAINGTITGSDAGATLIGGSGNDYLVGGMGDDVLIGGAGNDRLNGGGGNNVFVFAAGSGYDRVEAKPWDYFGQGTNTLKFTDADFSQMSCEIQGHDLVIWQPSGEAVRVLDVVRTINSGSSNGFELDWRIADRTGATLDLAQFAALRPLVTPADLADRQQQFVHEQYAQLSTQAQRLTDNGGSSYQAPVPNAVNQVNVQATPGQALSLNPYLDAVTSQAVTPVYVSEQVYTTATVTTPAHAGYFLAPALTSAGLPPGAVPVYGPGTGYAARQMLGYWVPPVAEQTQLVQTAAGWQTSLLWVYSAPVFDDTATQAFVTGTTGNDVVIQATSNSAYPSLFRGTIDTGAGDDTIILGTGANVAGATSWSRFDDWVGFESIATHWQLPLLYERGSGAWIDAGSGDDSVTGTDANDFIVGGAGSDWMDGQAGADTYFISYEAGSVDHISDLAQPRGTASDLGHSSDDPNETTTSRWNEDTIEFDSTIALSSLNFNWTSAALGDPGAPVPRVQTLQLYRDGELFLLIDYFNRNDDRDPALQSNVGVENFRFADGQTLSLDSLLATLSATAGDDVLAGSSVQSLLTGGQGDDIYVADLGTSSMIDASATSDDVYMWNGGDGVGKISDSGGNDILLIGAGVAVSQLWFMQVDNDLQVSVLGKNGYVQIKDWYTDSTHRLERIELASGKTLLSADVQQFVDAMGSLSYPVGSALPAEHQALLAPLLATYWHDQSSAPATSAAHFTGGAGNDIFLVDNVGDTVVEAAGGGTDTVKSSVSFTLGANVENLTLTGTSALNGTGNALDNVLIGNAGANTLAGDAGNDRFDGKAGDDLLIGGTGNDTYVFGRGYGHDTIQESDSTVNNHDVVVFGADISSDQLWFKQSGYDLEVSVIGTNDRLTLDGWYLGVEHHVEEFKLSNGTALLDNQVNLMVQAMASFAPPPPGTTTMSPSYQEMFAPVLAASWHS